MVARIEWDDDTRAIAAGAAVTVVITSVLWTIPWFVLWYYSDRALIGLEAPKYRQYRLLGGLFGGIAVGLLSELTDPAGLRGAYAASLGAGVIGGAYFAVNLVLETLFVYSTPPVAYVGVMTILVLLPMLPTFAVGGFLGGVVGRELRDLGRDLVERAS